MAEAYASLGLVYNAQGKYLESARALGKAEKLKPALPGVSLYLGIDYEKQRQANLAVPQLVEAVRLEPSNKEAHTWLARALWDDGRTEAAFEQLRQTALPFPTIRPCCWIWERPIARRPIWASSASLTVPVVRLCCIRSTETSIRMSMHGRIHWLITTGLSIRIRTGKVRISAWAKLHFIASNGMPRRRSITASLR